MIKAGEKFTNPSGEGGFEFKRDFDGKETITTRHVEAFGNEPSPTTGDVIAKWFDTELTWWFGRK